MTILNVNIKDKAAWNINQLSFKHVFKHDQIKSSVYLCLQKTIVKDTYWCLHNQLQISHVLQKRLSLESLVNVQAEILMTASSLEHTASHYWGKIRKQNS